MQEVAEQKARYFSTTEVADLLGIAPGTLAAWRSTRSDGPPFYKFGRRVLYRLDDLESWLAAHRAHSTAEVAQLRHRLIASKQEGA